MSYEDGSKNNGLITHEPVFSDLLVSAFIAITSVFIL